MKKFVSLFLILLFAATTVFAGNNLQKIYSIGCEEYEAMTYLYLAQGKALPSTAGPWSAAELGLMLSRIDRDALSSYEKTVYDWLSETVSGPDARFYVDENFSFSISGNLGLRATYHNNPEDFNGVDEVANGGTPDYKEPLPIISVPLETWIGDNIYGYSSFDLGLNRTFINAENENTKYKSDDYKTWDYDTDTIGFGFQSNIIMVPPSVLNDLNLNFPFKAFGAMGGDWYTFEVGRDNVAWGAGESGNLTIGDQLPYHNQARFTAFTDKFKYTFLMSFFPHPSSYFMTNTTDGTDYFYNWFSQDKDRNGVNAYIGHRLEWRIADKIGMALSESIMYQNDYGIDPMVLSPTAVFHNYYIRHNANSLLTFEVDWSPIKNIDIYGQVAIDEFKLPGEFTKAGPPSASGYILGAKGALPLNCGFLYGSVEGAYTDPYLYLRDDGSREPDKFGISYIVGVPEFVSGDASNYTLLPLGYKYGNDAVVANVNVGYKVFGKWYVEGNFRYLLDGCFDIFTRWDNDIVPGSENDPNAPSDKHADDGNYKVSSNWKERNAVAKNTAITLKAGYSVSERFNIEAEATYISIKNFKNIEGQSASDMQFQLSAVYSF